MFLSQLKLLDRKDKTAETIKRYFYDFKFKHPTPNDIKEPLKNVFRSANLDWYLVDWTNVEHDRLWYQSNG
jgi:hypothetical protein